MIAELPPGRSIIQADNLGWDVVDDFGQTVRWDYDEREQAVTAAWSHFGITREEYTAMRAALAQNVTWETLIAAIQVYQCEDCKRLYSDDFMACEGCGSEASVGPLGSDDIIGPWRAAAERLKEAEGEIKAQGYMLNTQYLEAEDDRAKCEAWEERASKAEAALASMTADRDTWRFNAEALNKQSREERAQRDAAITERNALEADIGKTDQAAEKLLEQRDGALIEVGMQVEERKAAEAQRDEARVLAEEHRVRRQEVEDCCQGGSDAYPLPWPLGRKGWKVTRTTAGPPTSPVSIVNVTNIETGVEYGFRGDGAEAKAQAFMKGEAE